MWKFHTGEYLDKEERAQRQFDEALEELENAGLFGAAFRDDVSAAGTTSSEEGSSYYSGDDSNSSDDYGDPGDGRGRRTRKASTMRKMGIAYTGDEEGGRRRGAGALRVVPSEPYQPRTKSRYVRGGQP